MALRFFLFRRCYGLLRLHPSYQKTKFPVLVITPNLISDVLDHGYINVLWVGGAEGEVGGGRWRWEVAGGRWWEVVGGGGRWWEVVGGGLGRGGGRRVE